eukprot:CAMPEP_0172414646 /NCGR_PEP_ID=MMETSP1064-20121228/1294_1 /TAXON_ID=202472 /ORGANISM="Aulacoseira subarctica , Strain CCAP 1002/5" /LENGTH=240 /DNA_ID=CAMNT_0013151415 /DNA_START=86 /DNA_END=809 /DNA_ORIENTATION=-
MAPPKGRVLIKYTSCLPACAAGPECKRPGTVAQSTHRCPDCDRHIHGTCGVPNPDRGSDRPGDSFTWSQLCIRCAAKRGLTSSSSSVAKRARKPNNYQSQEGTTTADDEAPPAEQVTPSPNVKTSVAASKKQRLEGPASSTVRRARVKQVSPEDERNVEALAQRGVERRAAIPDAASFRFKAGCATRMGPIGRGAVNRNVPTGLLVVGSVTGMVLKGRRTNAADTALLLCSFSQVILLPE